MHADHGDTKKLQMWRGAKAQGEAAKMEQCEVSTENPQTHENPSFRCFVSVSGTQDA